MTLEDIRLICLSLPETTEDVKWGNDLVFSIGGKMYIVLGLDESPTSASFKVRDEEFEEMCDHDGFKPAPYVARYKWVRIDNIERLSQKEWVAFIKQSYELVKDKLSAKLKKELSI
jgi:predicted DNA-binding protein (MmcQ/YjbR family)